ncbi:uncharacterized protein LOC144906906 [Branchiostoma floridae x Branchiostoma belcheri]
MSHTNRNIATSTSGTPSKILITSVLDGSTVYGVPVYPAEPRGTWRQRFSVNLGQKGWALLYKLKAYTVDDIASMGYVVLTGSDIDEVMRRTVQSTMEYMLLDTDVHVSTRVRHMKAYITRHGHRAIVLSCRHLNRYIGKPLVLVEENEIVLKTIHKSELVIGPGERGERLHESEIPRLARVVERMLQEMPVGQFDQLQPQPVLPDRVERIGQKLANFAKEKSDDDTSDEDIGCQIHMNPALNGISQGMLETMLLIFYRHEGPGYRCVCQTCGTVNIVLTHVIEQCSNARCNQRKLLAQAYARHVKAAGCTDYCRIPFCGQINYLVKDDDVRSPSTWLTTTVVEKLRLSYPHR